MANKSTRLMLDALARAAAEPAGMPLYSAKNSLGLFPNTSTARQVAQRCQEDGYLTVVASEANGQAAREVAVLTEKGFHWLMTQTNPRQVLEDFVRVLEERRGQVIQLIATTQNLAAGLHALASAVERLRGYMPSSERNGRAPKVESAIRDSLDQEILRYLEAWHAVESGDCPLPRLFEKLHESHADISIGQFHDALRGLHNAHRLWLHPWTGPLYQLPEPALALLIGHEIGYYASLRDAESGVNAAPLG